MLPHLILNIAVILDSVEKKKRLIFKIKFYFIHTSGFPCSGRQIQIKAIRYSHTFTMFIKPQSFSTTAHLLLQDLYVCTIGIPKPKLI